MKQPLSPEIKQRCITMYAAGTTQSEIAATLGIGKSTVYTILRRDRDAFNEAMANALVPDEMPLPSPEVLAMVAPRSTVEQAVEILGRVTLVELEAHHRHVQEAVLELRAVWSRWETGEGVGA